MIRNTGLPDGGLWLLIVAPRAIVWRDLPARGRSPQWRAGVNRPNSAPTSEERT